MGKQGGYGKVGVMGSMAKSSFPSKPCIFFVPGGPFHFYNYGYHDFSAARGVSVVIENGMCALVYVLDKTRGIPCCQVQ